MGILVMVGSEHIRLLLGAKEISAAESDGEEAQIEEGGLAQEETTGRE